MLGLRTALLIVLCLAGVLAVPGTLRAELVSRQQGLQATLQEAVTAFEQADYARAAEGFSYLSQTYGEEEAYRELERQLLPVWAHACRMKGDPTRAAELYESFLEKYPDDDAQAPFVLFGLAQACQALGDNARAAEAYQHYRERFPERPEALLSVLREADLAFSDGQTGKGIDELLAFAASPRVPPTLRAQARLRAVQAAQAAGDDRRAAEILLEEPWAVTTMPELAILAFAGLQAGNYLAAEGRYADAILAYRNVPPRHLLIHLQRQRLAQLEQIRRERTRRNPGGIQSATFWEEYFGDIIEKVRAELDELGVMEDYTPAWQLRLGEAFLRDGRSREAGLLFGKLATDESLAEDIRTQAHYRWILCSQAREDWDITLSRAESFHQNFPHHPFVPATVYICANALLQRGDHAKAVAALNFLIEGYPEHPQQPRWRFSRGYAKALAQDYAGAREDFTALITSYPGDPLALRARLWRGLSWFFEYNYSPALKEFDALIPEVLGTELEAETAYRRAATLYSIRNYTQARQALEDFLNKYPDSPHAPAASVLLGDTLMGLGELDAAATQFARVGPEAGALYPYAVFQTGKIYRVSEKYDSLITHFEAYTAIKVPESDPPPRLAEALYWIGWAQLQQGAPEKAFDQFMGVLVLSQIGDDPQAGETGPLLLALENLYERTQQGELHLTAELLEADSFTDWLEARRAQALKLGELTRASRFALYLAQTYRHQHRDNRADAVLFETMEQVPLDRLDAEGLSTLGGVLAEHKFPSAQEYFLTQLKTFPRSSRNGQALYGLAQLAADEGDDEQAEKWLRRFEAETPFHAEASQAALLHAQVLMRQNRTEEAADVLENLIRQSSARGRAHAESLLMLAELTTTQNDPRRAIAYDQRVYTLYRAYPDLLARAYWHSAQAFLEIGDEQAALRTLVEMTDDPRLADTPEFSPAFARRQALETKLSADNPPTSADVSTEEEAAL